MFATHNDDEIYSSSASMMYPFYHTQQPQLDGQYSQLQKHDAQSIGLQPPIIYSTSPVSANGETAEEMHRRMRREWMKRVAEWIAQTQGVGSDTPHKVSRISSISQYFELTKLHAQLDSIPETAEEPNYGSSCEEVLYVASPPGAAGSPYGYAGSAFTSSSASSSSSSSSNSWSSAKSLRRLSHGRTCSLESISEEAEE